MQRDFGGGGGGASKHYALYCKKKEDFPDQMGGNATILLYIYLDFLDQNF